MSKRSICISQPRNGACSYSPRSSRTRMKLGKQGTELKYMQTSHQHKYKPATLTVLQPETADNKSCSEQFLTAFLRAQQPPPALYVITWHMLLNTDRIVWCLSRPPAAHAASSTAETQLSCWLNGGLSPASATQSITGHPKPLQSSFSEVILKDNSSHLSGRNPDTQLRPNGGLGVPPLHARCQSTRGYFFPSNPYSEWTQQNKPVLQRQTCKARAEQQGPS